ncbi:hypothetical protein D3C76_1177720 [compost metagenome]
MQVFGKGLGQTVGNRFNHDFIVIIMLRFVGIRQRVLLQPAGYGKGTDVVRFTAQLRRDEIGQAVVGKTDLLGLLTQMMADRQHVGARFIAIDLDVIAHTVGREQPHHAARVEGFLLAELIEQVVGILKQALGLFTHHFIFEDARIFSGQRPGHKERRPVDVVAQGFNAGRHLLHAQTMGNRRRIA